MLSRFMRELRGDLGPRWQKIAQDELDKVRQEIEDGDITIDESGIARNCIGRVVMDDLLEKIVLVSGKVDKFATEKAYGEEVEKELAEYRAARVNYTPTREELNEMRAVFGEGAEVVDVITGTVIHL